MLNPEVAVASEVSSKKLVWHAPVLTQMPVEDAETGPNTSENLITGS